MSDEDASSSSSDEEEERERKRHKKEKQKKEKHKKDKHKKDKHKKDKHKHKKSKHEGGEGAGGHDAASLAGARAQIEASMQPISEADYFLKTKEYQLWLSEARKTFLDEIPAEEARSLFKKFVAKWNAKELPPKYYVGCACLPPAAVVACARHRTAHAGAATASAVPQAAKRPERRRHARLAPPVGLRGEVDRGREVPARPR